MQKLSAGTIIAIAITALFLTFLTSGVLLSSQTVPSGGTITAVNVGVYSDSLCTQNCTSINWGSIAPGNSATTTIYVKNTGNLPITLSMTVGVGSWVPTNANSYLSVTWNRENTPLSANASIAATLTLTATANAGNITSFSFNVIVTGTQS